MAGRRAISVDAETPEYARTFMAGLKAAGVEIVTALPDSLLKHVYGCCEQDNAITYIPVASEAELPGICVGAYFGGKKALMVMENSGIRQACEPIARLSLCHHLPMVMVLAYRGALGERNWWGHNHAQTMEPILDALRIPYWFVDKLDDVTPSLRRAFDHADSSQWPVALVFTGACVNTPPWERSGSEP